jgi:hypothetical protein
MPSSLFKPIEFFERTVSSKIFNAQPRIAGFLATEGAL